MTTAMLVAVAEAEQVLQAAGASASAAYDAACVYLLAATYGGSSESERYSSRGAALLERARELGLLRILPVVQRMKSEPELESLRRYGPFEKLFRDLPETPDSVAPALIESLEAGE